MTFLEVVEQIYTLPPAVQLTTTSGALGVTLAAFLEKIHGPLSTVALVLSIVWISLQIGGWVAARWKKRRGKR